MINFAVLEAMRPKQWFKNVFLLAGIVFSLKFTNIFLLVKVFFAIILFSAISGTVYILNDIVDYEKDKIHPTKKKRPIAAGRLNKNTALFYMVVIFLISILLAFWLNISFGLISLVYFFMNIGYSFYLKQQVIFDVFIIAFGFVIRASAGAMVINEPISPWLLICTMQLALFIALCKRRNELCLMNNQCEDHRAVLKDYSVELIDQMTSVVTASSLMSYSLYTVSQDVITKLGTDKLYLTIPFVLFGIFRYLYLVHKKNLGGSPELIVLKDVPMIIDLVGFSFIVLVALYF